MRNMFVGLFAASFCSLPMFSQSTRFLSAEAQRFPSPGLSLSANPCSDNAHRDVDALPKEAWQTDSPFSSCNRPVRKASADLPAAPCNPSTQETTPCSASSDPVRDDLKARGKQGQVILRARDKVLEILQTENACTAWYRTKDPDPAATFRTVTYALDRDMSEAEAIAYWMGEDRETLVAEDETGEIPGTYYLKPNQAGGGRHIANCGYATAKAFGEARHTASIVVRRANAARPARSRIRDVIASPDVHTD